LADVQGGWPIAHAPDRTYSICHTGHLTHRYDHAVDSFGGGGHGGWAARDLGEAQAPRRSGSMIGWVAAGGGGGVDLDVEPRG
ncbi:hypothetical protein, partial [Pseudomonas syringae group genomosp. 7]|uniref:hypothetical protein n=1 Tax=Pseudomonas syringae group genomosp. 7 TaxID=251699 RepID=UPI00376F7B7E